ncbi:MAG: hypothetical protein JNG84_13510, partial [Archangium sp.]|nr:hypothetical protein [Archangium sp.]
GAVALLVAGLVSVLMVPLLAFLALVARDASSALVGRSLCIPVAALVAVMGVVSRVFSALQPGTRAHLGWLFSLVAGAGFLARIHPLVLWRQS